MRRQATLKEKIGGPGKITVQPLTYNVGTLKGGFDMTHVELEKGNNGGGDVDQKAVVDEEEEAWVPMQSRGSKQASYVPPTADLFAEYDTPEHSGERDADSSSISLYSINEEANRPPSAAQRLSSAIRDRAVRFMSGHQTIASKRASNASSQVSRYSTDSWRRSGVPRPTSTTSHTPSPLASGGGYAI